MKADERIINTKAATNEDNNSFVGIRIKSDRIDFHYPESYDLSPISDIKSFRRDLLSVLRTISLAKTTSSPLSTTENAAAKTKSFALISYLWIIRDYLTNGFYRNKEKLYRLNGKGKVNWKKTLETQPIISNGNIIYNNLVVETKNDCDDIISDAHKLCVFDSVKKVGWLFSIDERAVRVPIVSNSTIKKYINAIKTELLRTFDDAKRLRLNHMIKVLAGVDDYQKLDEIVYGVDKYDYIYERMLDALFSNVDDMKKYNPNANWYLLKNNMQAVEASSLRPDTIRIEHTRSNDPLQTNEKTAYIIDAKFYRFGSTGQEKDLPETTSIQKQITYGDHIISNFQAADSINIVRNAFIMPYNKNNNTLGYSSNLEYIGYTKANWRSNHLSHEKVHAFLIDTKHLISSWTQGNCNDDIEKLISDIEEYSKK